MSKHHGIVIVVEFKIKPGAMPAFLDAITSHARNTLLSEPGCQQFDVIEDPADPSRIVLYEVYADAAAFAAHEAAPYLARFFAATSDLVESQSVRRLERHSHPQKPGGAAGKVLVAPAHLAARRELLQPLVAAGLELVLNPFERALNAAELIGLLPGVVATIAGGEPYSEQVLSQAPDLRVVARLGVGHDAIDLRAATRHGVAIAMAFGTNHEPVADMAFTLMAALTHRLLDYHRRVETGSWGPTFHGRLHGTTIGIVGFGRIGRAVAKRCQGFNMEVLVADPVMDADTVARLGCRLLPLDELLAGADIVSLHAP
jgi:quinol monooxygenase YgiN